MFNPRPKTMHAVATCPSNFTRAPSGQKRRILMLDASGNRLDEVDGWFVPMSEDPAGTLFVPEPRPGAVAIAADGLPAVVLDPSG